MIKPRNLQKDDTIAIISPAGAVENTASIYKTADMFRNWGLNVRFSSTTFSRSGYYSAPRANRIQDLISTIYDDTIAAILCSYGGYGCIQLVEEFSIAIQKQPKWILGMSDCSVLHAASVRAGTMSLHSPQCRHLSEEPDGIAAEHIRRILFGELPTFSCSSNKFCIPGVAQGMLIGGNLSILCTLLRTPYDPFMPGTILFIEDINEPAYRIERMIYSLKLAGVLGSINGLIIGSFEGCKENISLGGTIYELIRNIVSEYNIPVCFGYPVGHGKENMPLIEGAKVQLTVGNIESRIEYIP